MSRARNGVKPPKEAEKDSEEKGENGEPLHQTLSSLSLRPSHRQRQPQEANHTLDLLPEDQADFCPICRSNSFFDKNLRFKVNSKCYHRICEACVDRHFASGKATCPIANCAQEVWKRDWRVQTFQDLKIEREVDIRKRVMVILNRREEEFETKRDWDDFLELREGMIMDLAMSTNVNATNRKLREYEKANLLSIKANNSTGAMSQFTREASPTDHSGLVKGLKKITRPPPVAAYDPFMGMSTKRDYYDIRDDYPSKRLAKAKSDLRTLAGGFSFQQYYDESLLRAFAGLGCFIEDEMAEREQQQQASLAPAILNDGSDNDIF